MARMARVLVVTVAHPPGDARILHREIAALCEHGHHVTYAAPFEAFGCIPPREPRTKNVPRSEGNLLRRIPAVLAAFRLVLRERAKQDVILVHDPELLPALAAARLPSRWPRPVAVWDVHEDVPAQVAMLPLPGALRWAVAGLIHGTELVAEHAFELLLAETAYQGRFRRRHPVVPNSVRLRPGGPWPAEDQPRVIYIGSLTWARGAQELMEIAAALPGVTVELIGNAKADVEDAIRAAAARLPNLHYRGFVPNDLALARLPGALAGLSLLHDEPNYQHSQPTKVMEYMAHAVPSITTPNAASRELVESTDSGLVVAFGDVGAVIESIRCLDADRGERERLAANAYSAAAAHDWNRDGHEFVELLEQWADRARKSSRSP